MTSACSAFVPACVCSSWPVSQPSYQRQIFTVVPGRCDSDSRVSFSWIGAWYGSEAQWHPFIEPMIGLSASGVYAGLWRDLESDPVRLRQHRHARIRPKIGIIRTYNDPWIPNEQEWYGYAGIEFGLSQFFLGVNMQAGMLIGEESYPSIGVGFGF